MDTTPAKFEVKVHAYPRPGKGHAQVRFIYYGRKAGTEAWVQITAPKYRSLLKAGATSVDNKN